MQKPVWIIGCGDIGLRVSNLLLPDHRPIQAIVQSHVSLSKCHQTHIDCLQIDLDTEKLPPFESFNDCDLFYFTPPPGTGLTDTRIKRFLEHCGNAPKRIVLISTTGVYGDCQGEWVDEDSPVQPQAARAIRRLDAEQQLKQWASQHQREYVILRVAGIYAADRLPLARLKKGLPLVNESEASWTNRIHADDLAQVCVAAMLTANNNTVFNVSDGSPSTMTDYFNRVADATGLPRPPLITLDEAKLTLSSGMVSYLSESRRILNHKMLELMEVSLQYPDLNEGLKTINSTSIMTDHKLQE